MPTHAFTAEIPPIALNGEDIIVRDPDNPETEVEWRISRRRTSSEGVVVIDYSTGDGTEGTHAFENPAARVTVRIRTIATVVAAELAEAAATSEAADESSTAAA